MIIFVIFFRPKSVIFDLVMKVTARQQSGQEIYTQTVKVEVYTPPVVHPHDIFLVPGASFVVRAFYNCAPC